MTEEEKSFREKVEEIRERRSESTKVSGSTTKSGSSVTKNMISLAGGTDESDISTETIHADRVIIHTGGERLEFIDRDVSLMDFLGNRMYSVSGDPDRRTEDHSGAEASSSDSNPTKVFDPSSKKGDEAPTTDSTTLEMSWCPECGTDLTGFDTPKFCPSCRHEFGP